MTTPSCARRSGTAPASTRPASAACTASRRCSATLSTRLLERARLDARRRLRAAVTTLEDLYQLAEQLITWDERTILWRFQHLKTVERIIGGNVIGTQGTPVDVLGKRIDVRFFPDLWTVRDEITRRSALGTDGHGR